MKICRKALILLLGVLLCIPSLLLCGCGEDDLQSQASGATADQANLPRDLAAIGIDPQAAGIFPQVIHDKKNDPGFQLKEPKDGDTIAVLHTAVGDITLRLFPDQAPKTVTNFINLAKAGAYDNTPILHVVRGEAVHGGYCPSDDANPNGVSSYGAPFEDEFCDSLYNLRGAVAMANTGRDANGTRFFINQADAEDFRKNGGWRGLKTVWRLVTEKLAEYRDTDLLGAYITENGDKFLNPDTVPENVRQLYTEYGGNPQFDGVYNTADRGCTVFAQVINGMDVADKLAQMKTDEEHMLIKPVLIKSVEITTYQKNYSGENK